MGNKIRVELSRGGGRTAKYSGDPGACFKCGQMGHWARFVISFSGQIRSLRNTPKQGVSEPPTIVSALLPAAMDILNAFLYRGGGPHRRPHNPSDPPLIDRIQPSRDYPPQPPRDFPPYRDDFAPGRFPPARDPRYGYDYPPVPPPGRDVRRSSPPPRDYRDYHAGPPPMRSGRDYDDYRMRGPPPPPPPRYDARPGYFPHDSDGPPGYPPRGYPPMPPPPPRDYYDRHDRRSSDRYPPYPPSSSARPRTPPGGPPPRGRDDLDRPPPPR